MLLTITLLKGLPTQHASPAFGSYMMVSLATGLLNSWPAPACTNPIFAGRPPHALPDCLPLQVSPSLKTAPCLHLMVLSILASSSRHLLSVRNPLPIWSRQWPLLRWAFDKDCARS